MAEQANPAKQEWPLDWMPAFLAALRNSANVRAACQAAGVSRQMTDKARIKYPRFAAAWTLALEDAIDTLEAVAWDRARKQSDYLLWKLLASLRREKYGDTVTVRIDLEKEAERIARERNLPPEQAARIISLAEKLKQRSAG